MNTQEKIKLIKAQLENTKINVASKSHGTKFHDTAVRMDYRPWQKVYELYYNHDGKLTVETFHNLELAVRRYEEI